MLFDTVAEYDAEILETRNFLKGAMKEQAHTSGGPGAGMHSQKGDVRAMKEYLELLSKERTIVLARQGGQVNRAIFGREH
jgi:hypothetical protein